MAKCGARRLRAPHQLLEYLYRLWGIPETYQFLSQDSQFAQPKLSAAEYAPFFETFKETLSQFGPLPEPIPGQGGHFSLRHGFSQGLPPAELYALAEIAFRYQSIGDDLRQERQAQGFGVLARAIRAAQPGRIFARAAAIGEVDPLTNLDSRLFVGLSI